MINKLFPHPHPDSTFEDEEEQTYEDFLDYGRRKPNSSGTGRWKLTPQRSKLGVLYFGAKANRPPHIRFFTDFLSAYFCLDVIYEEQFDAIDVSTNTFRLDELEYDILAGEAAVVTTKGRSNKRKRMKPPKCADVFSLFDVLVHKVNPKGASMSRCAVVIGLFDLALMEDGKEVLGRACGDRVACASLTANPSLKSILCTSIHELLHTIGFDHCNSERCVMNAIAYEDWLFLSRLNMEKLKLFHTEGSTNKTTSKSSNNNNNNNNNSVSEIQSKGVSEHIMIRQKRVERYISQLFVDLVASGGGGAAGDGDGTCTFNPPSSGDSSTSTHSDNTNTVHASFELNYYSRLLSLLTEFTHPGADIRTATCSSTNVSRNASHCSSKRRRKTLTATGTYTTVTVAAAISKNNEDDAAIQAVDGSSYQQSTTSTLAVHHGRLFDAEKYWLRQVIRYYSKGATSTGSTNSSRTTKCL